MIDYAKLAILGAICAAVFGSGWWVGYSKYLDFKKEVEVTARVQEAKVESIRSQQELVTKGIENEYEAKIAALRNYYKSTSVWNNTSSGKVPGISAAPSATDVIASYNILAGKCSETTQQLVSLQSWLNEQIGIK
jgi:hypothetical protein